MTTAAPSTMNEIDIFRHQAASIDFVARANVEGLTHEESLIQPRPGGNCLNWIMGHLLSTYNDVLPLLEQEPVRADGALARYARGSAPIEGPDEALTFQTLLAAWDEAVERIDAGLAGLTPEALDRSAPVSPNDDPDETVRSLLTTVLFHQAYHAGQLGVLRRIAGKDGAIR